MADITLCVPTKWCPLKLRCHRYLAEPGPKYQSYADFSERWAESFACEDFWPEREEKDGKRGS